MPRTKIPKNSKRNREVAGREEKIRLYELKMDSTLMHIEDLGNKYLSAVDSDLQLINDRMSTELRQMKMNDFLHILCNLSHFCDYKASDQTQSHLLSTTIASQSQSNYSNINGQLSPTPSTTTTSNGLTVPATGSRNDEGYLTEDSSLGAMTASGSSNTLAAFTGSSMRSGRGLRTPGPLSSARAYRARRSRSACSELNVLPSAKPNNNTTNNNRNSRSKMRTPMAPKQKALSAERTPRVLPSHKLRNSSPSTPPLAILRWPKPNEIALSKFGSPLVAQVMPDKFANVNIPTRNGGVLRLQPKSLHEVKENFVESLSADTLRQIKTLHENLGKIVRTAHEAGLE